MPMTMKKRSGEPISKEILDDLLFLKSRNGEGIDLSDMPEIVDWSRAVQGKFYRPVKQPFSIRLDADVIAWFKASGDGYQTRINSALREYVIAHQAENKV